VVGRRVVVVVVVELLVSGLELELLPEISELANEEMKELLGLEKAAVDEDEDGDDGMEVVPIEGGFRCGSRDGSHVTR